MTVLIRLRQKYRRGATPKSIKGQKTGNGKRARANKISWKRGTGEGVKR